MPLGARNARGQILFFSLFSSFFPHLPSGPALGLADVGCREGAVAILELREPVSCTRRSCPRRPSGRHGFASLRAVQMVGQVSRITGGCRRTRRADRLLSRSARHPRIQRLPKAFVHSWSVPSGSDVTIASSALVLGDAGRPSSDGKSRQGVRLSRYDNLAMGRRPLHFGENWFLVPWRASAGCRFDVESGTASGSAQTANAVQCRCGQGH